MKKLLSIILAFGLSTPLAAGGDKRSTVIFEEVLGMPIITVHTSQGKKRFVLDTGSAISSMDIDIDRELTVSVGGKRFQVRFRPTQTKVFHEFEALLPPGEQVDGILGSDFMRHFRHVSFDFNGSLVSFE